MTKLRIRLLVALVLAAVMLAGVGIEVASARQRTRQDSSPGTAARMTRPGVGRFAGEPDPSGSGAPVPTVKPASLTSQPGLWILHRWFQWRARGQYDQHHLPKR